MRRFRNTIRKPATRRRPRRLQAAADATLDLHGDTTEQAVAKLERALSDHELHTLLVVHGKGTGILRRRVRACLRAHPDVREVRCGEDCGLPGGDGVTWCRLG